MHSIDCRPGPRPPDPLRAADVFGVQDIDEDEGVAAVHEAFKLGINFFDTSPFYGTTRSETVLGRALAALPRNEIIVATKVGRYGAEEFDFSAERVTREFDASLGRLGLDYVDILQCHDIEFGDLDQVRSGDALPRSREPAVPVATACMCACCLRSSHPPPELRTTLMRRATQHAMCAIHCGGCSGGVAASRYTAVFTLTADRHTCADRADCAC